MDVHIYSDEMYPVYFAYEGKDTYHLNTTMNAKDWADYQSVCDAFEEWQIKLSKIEKAVKAEELRKKNENVQRLPSNF